MAHFAEIRTDNHKVLRVIVVDNADVAANGGDQSTQAETWVSNNISQDPIILEELGTYPTTYWKQTSYNNNFRGIFAGVDYTYDSTADKFKPRKPYDSWTWDDTDWNWKPPVDVPTDDNRYRWDEDNTEWVSI